MACAACKKKRARKRSWPKVPTHTPKQRRARPASHTSCPDCSRATSLRKSYRLAGISVAQLTAMRAACARCALKRCPGAPRAKRCRTERITAKAVNAQIERRRGRS